MPNVSGINNLKMQKSSVLEVFSLRRHTLPRGSRASLTVIITFPEIQIRKETQIGLPQGNKKKGFAGNIFNFFFHFPNSQEQRINVTVINTLLLQSEDLIPSI